MPPRRRGSFPSWVVVLGGLVALVVAAGTAQAGERTTPDQAATGAALRLREAELAMIAVRDEPDATPAQWELVGERFLAVADEARLLKRGDEALSHAAFCFARGGATDRALAATQRLRDEFPKSPLAAQALYQSAHYLIAIGEMAAAADAFALHAKQYPARPDAEDALENALGLYAALGDEPRMLDALARFQRVYGKRDPARLDEIRIIAAGHAQRHGRVDTALALYQAYLKDGRRDVPERMILAKVAVGAMLWRKACGAPLVDSLCARRGQPIDGRPAPLTAVARAPKLVKLAMAAFADASTIGGAVGDPSMLVRHALGRVRLYQLEQAIEAVLAMGPVPVYAIEPSGRMPPAAMKRFGQWLQAWQQRGSLADRATWAVFERRDLGTAIAAAARIALLSEAMADTLLTAPLPKGLHDPDLRRVYRDQLDEIAAPLPLRAKEAAVVCLTRARDLGVVDDNLAICQRLVDRYEPTRFVLDERFATPGVPAPVLELAPPVLVDPTGPAAAPATATSPDTEPAPP